MFPPENTTPRTARRSAAGPRTPHGVAPRTSRSSCSDPASDARRAAVTDERPLAAADYENLLAFRASLRKFLSWSEIRAREAGLTPVQHQLLLAIKGHPGGQPPAVGDLAGWRRGTRTIAAALDAYSRSLAQARSRRTVPSPERHPCDTTPGKDGRSRLPPPASRGEETLSRRASTAPMTRSQAPPARAAGVARVRHEPRRSPRRVPCQNSHNGSELVFSVPVRLLSGTR